jgi:6-carboxyhexanoate--CoA ligase
MSPVPQNAFYSIRMRASFRKRHVSGAERLVTRDRIDVTVRNLVARARDRELEPDRIIVSVDPLGDGSPSYLTSLDVTTLETSDHLTGRQYAARVLKLAGVSEQAVASAMELIGKGAAPSGANMRGALIMDAATGERLEPDQERGIRASRFDWSDDAFQSAAQQLAGRGLRHHRTAEALALATKVAHAPGMVAELCWSDEPDYTAGYVASLDIGYVRFPFLKKQGDAHGGRAFFVRHDAHDLTALLRYLETEAVLIHAVGLCNPTMDPTAFLTRMESCHV